jgi:hypothetical protein
MTALENRPVSTSEAGDMAKCETLWKIKYHPAYRLQPISDGPSVTRGITGHRSFEEYLIKITQGASHTEAAEFVVSSLMEAGMHYMTKGDMAKSKMYSEMCALMDAYFKHYGDFTAEWEILGIENKVEDPSFGFVGRLDVLIKYKSGRYINQVAVWDWKFLGDFWNDKAYRMNASAANYLRAAKAMFPNEDIVHMVFDEIRFRTDAKDKFRRHYVDYEPVKQRNVNKNHEIYAARARKYSALSREEADAQIPRAMVKTTCEYCLVETLCEAQLREQDTTLMEKVNYKPNTYGYQD